MRAIHRECHKALQPGVWFTFLIVLLTFVSIRTYWAWVWAGLLGIDTAGAVMNLRMAQVLLIAFMIWHLLVRRQLLAPDTGLGLALAAFGVHCRLTTDVVTITMEWNRGYGSMWGPPYPETTLIQEGAAGSEIESLYNAVSYGGLAAYILGFAAVVFVAVADARRQRSTR